jgi:hypothetical protein
VIFAGRHCRARQRKGATLRTVCNQAGIPGNDFPDAYEKAG